MGDDRTKARTTVGKSHLLIILGFCTTPIMFVLGSMNWMAPEVLERPYDERSDVWSLGCITLEMATCGFMDVRFNLLIQRLCLRIQTGCCRRLKVQQRCFKLNSLRKY